MRIFAIAAIALAFFLAVPARAADAPRLLWEYPTGGDMPQSIAADLQRQVIYVAAKTGGLLILDVARAPKILARIAKTDLGNLDAMYVAQQGDYLYLALGDFFNAGGDRAGLAVVDINNPQAPKVLAVWASTGKMHGAATVAVSGNYAYLGAMSDGVLVFDISDKNAPALAVVFRPDPNWPRRNPGRTAMPNARGLAIDGNLLYVADDAGGLRLADITDPRYPREISHYINLGIGTSKQQAYNNIALDGRMAYVAVDYCGMEALDISDLHTIKQTGWWNPWHCESPGNIWLNSKGHANQIAYDPTRHLVYLSAGGSELQAVDVTDPRHPASAGNYANPRGKQGVWGMTLARGRVYLAYITAFIPFRGTWNGIRALDPIYP